MKESMTQNFSRQPLEPLLQVHGGWKLDIVAKSPDLQQRTAIFLRIAYNHKWYIIKV